MILTYKYRLKGKRSARQLRRLAFQSNQVWNYCVQTQRSVQRTWKFGLSPKWSSQYDLQALTAGTSKDLNLPDVAVGIDLGLRTLATLSTGEKIGAPGPTVSTRTS